MNGLGLGSGPNIWHRLHTLRWSYNTVHVSGATYDHIKYFPEIPEDNILDHIIVLLVVSNDIL